MGWRDNLVPASFRGSPFLVNDSTLDGGRRVVVHEFPGRDTGFTEDLGKKNRKYRIVGYILGEPPDPDYFPDRDALIQALEAAGSGTLSHPYLGSLTVNVETFSMRETKEEGGMAIFTMEFVDSGSLASPINQQDTQGQSQGGANGTDNQLNNDFGFG